MGWGGTYDMAYRNPPTHRYCMLLVSNILSKLDKQLKSNNMFQKWHSSLAWELPTNFSMFSSLLEWTFELPNCHLNAHIYAFDAMQLLYGVLIHPVVLWMNEIQKSFFTMWPTLSTSQTSWGYGGLVPSRKLRHFVAHCWRKNMALVITYKSGTLSLWIRVQIYYSFRLTIIVLPPPEYMSQNYSPISYVENCAKQFLHQQKSINIWPQIIFLEHKTPGSRTIVLGGKECHLRTKFHMPITKLQTSISNMTCKLCFELRSNWSVMNILINNCTILFIVQTHPRK